MFWDNSSVFIYWCVSGVIGFILFILGILVFCDIKRKHRIEIAVMIEFAACWILYAPYEFTLEYNGDHFVLHVLHSGIGSLLKSFTKVLGDGYENVAYEGKPVFSLIYGGLTILVNLFLLVLVAGCVIKFLDSKNQRFKLFWSRNKVFYVFSEYNFKTWNIADSIPDRDDSVIVFMQSGTELSDDQKFRIISKGFMVIEGDIKEFIRKNLSKAVSMEIFLFNEKEQDNLSDLKQISDLLSNSTVKTKVFVELSDTPWDMYNGFLAKNNNSDSYINFVRVEETYAYNNLLHNSIFDNYTGDKNGEREIKFLIAGVNDRNIEMLKTILHLSQMPYYRPSIVIIDEEDRPDYLTRLMPDVKSECDVRGDAIYKLDYIGGIDGESFRLEEIIDEHSDFTFAYVNIGDDLKNIRTALMIDSVCRKKSKTGGYKIQVSILDDSITEMWNGNLLSGLQLTGMNHDVYSYSFISMSDIESLSEKIHDARQKERNSNTTWREYCNSEYDRHSVYARTLSYRYKLELIRELGLDMSVTGQTDPWLIYEHMRWDMYTRTLGYSCPEGALKERLDSIGLKLEELGRKRKELDKDSEEAKNIAAEISALKEERKLIRSKARVHENLVHFDDLTYEVQQYDSLKLTEDVVNAYDDMIAGFKRES